MTDTDLQAVEKQLQEQIHFIEQAIEQAKRDEITDITATEKAVTDICTQVMSLEPAAAQAMQQKMLEMISRLEELAFELQAYQNRIDPQPDDTNEVTAN